MTRLQPFRGGQFDPVTHELSRLEITMDSPALRREYWDAQRAVLHVFMEQQHDPAAALEVLSAVGLAYHIPRGATEQETS